MLQGKTLHGKNVNWLKPDRFSSTFLLSELGQGGLSLLTRKTEKMMLLQRQLPLQNSSQVLIMMVDLKKAVGIVPVEMSREKIYISTSIAVD